jgi:hypothetical protein
VSASTAHPRPDQIAELTRGYEIPFPPLAEPHLDYIVRTIAVVWEGLSTRHPATMATGSEPEVTALLVTALCRLIDVDPRWRQMVHLVTRGTETLNYDGRHLQKEPDLSIHLTCRPGLFPFIVECKIIDAANGKTVRLYRLEGIDRFLSGDYAWATREALMLAFVRDGSTTAAALAPILRVPLAALPSSRLIPASAVHGSSPAPDLAHSVHGRGFRYPGMPILRDDPGPIRLLHLWLQ